MVSTEINGYHRRAKRRKNPYAPLEKVTNTVMKTDLPPPRKTLMFYLCMQATHEVFQCLGSSHAEDGPNNAYMFLTLRGQQSQYKKDVHL